MCQETVFSLPYFGNIEFFATFLHAKQPIIDLGEHYVKQSYRTRTYILGANRILPLSVPIAKMRGTKQSMDSVTISYETDWQRIHLLAIKSAYGSSPFFEYYFDEIAEILQTKHLFLKDLSLALFEHLLQLLQIDKPFKVSTQYYQGNGTDLRNVIQPKNKHPFLHQEYTQVFSEKHGFAQNLSIIDLLFNEGPNAENVLIQ